MSTDWYRIEIVAGPGRPDNPHKTKQVAFAATPKLLRYLDDLILEEGRGNSRGEVARALVWSAVEDLVSKGILTRRAGRFEDDEEAEETRAPGKSP